MKYDIDWVIKTGKEKVRSSIDEYEKFLKVMGNNYKYTASAQLNIYCINPKATACAKFNFWKNKMGRTVKFREKGIPVYSVKNGKQKVNYIFDISQTKRLLEKDKFNLWKFKKEHQEIFQELSGISDFEEGKTKIIQDYSKNIDYSKYPSKYTTELKNFIEKSVKIAIDERIGQKDKIEFSEDEKKILKEIFDKDFFEEISNEISNVSRNILTEVRKKITERSLEKLSNVR